VLEPDAQQRAHAQPITAGARHDGSIAVVAFVFDRPKLDRTVERQVFSSPGDSRQDLVEIVNYTDARNSFAPLFAARGRRRRPVAGKVAQSIQYRFGVE